jgi:hypothetical protein
MKIEAEMRMTVKMRGFPLECVRQSAISTLPELGKVKRGEGAGGNACKFCHIIRLNFKGNKAGPKGADKG